MVCGRRCEQNRRQRQWPEGMIVFSRAETPGIQNSLMGLWYQIRRVSVTASVILEIKLPSSKWASYAYFMVSGFQNHVSRNLETLTLRWMFHWKDVFSANLHCHPSSFHFISYRSWLSFKSQVNNAVHISLVITQIILINKNCCTIITRLITPLWVFILLKEDLLQ